MDRNSASRFSYNPTINISRSKFDRSHSVKTTCNIGQIIPFFVDEVLPGDTFDVTTSKVARLQTLLAPIMDDIFLDTYYYFVPNRLVWEHWREFNGENTSSPWTQTTEYQIPQVEAPSGGWNVGTIADYMGVPTGISGLSISALPFRAYAMICNEFFRDENLSDPLNVNYDDTTITGSNGSTFTTDVCKGGAPYLACKVHDYFTSALPAPQKGSDVLVPGITGKLPVLTGNDYWSHDQFPHDTDNHAYGMNFIFDDNASATAGTIGSVNWASTATDKTQMVPKSGASGSTVGKRFVPNNLFVNANNLGAVSINTLRQAFQIQKLYEKDARGGTRYIEILKEHFGVSSPDARLQRPEYLGGNRINLNIKQVVQTSGTIESSETNGVSSTAQGHTTAYSATADSHSDFVKSFTEHGHIIGICVARYKHTYQQGLNRLWSRKDRFDFYWPVFANLGEQAIKNKEIYAQGSSVLNPSTGVAYDEEVFGYQEYAAEYRFHPNIVTGEMRSTYATSLDVWHLGDEYSSLPSLSDSWIHEDKTNVDRVLAVQSSVSNQLLLDIYIKNKCTRPMPMYSIPGLIDHN